jgi:hypothetical protein
MEKGISDMLDMMKRQEGAVENAKRVIIKLTSENLMLSNAIKRTMV